MGRWTLPEVRDGPKNPQGSQGRVGGHSQRSETSRETLPKVRDVSGDPPGGSGRVKGPSCRSGTDRGTVREVRHGSGTLLEDLPTRS